MKTFGVIVLIATLLAAAMLVLFLDGAAFKQPSLEFEITKARSLALEWLKNNAKENGLFEYIVDPQTGTLSSKNNDIRQLMAGRVAAQESSSDTQFKAIHRKNLTFIMEHWFKETEDGKGYIYYNNRSKLGGNAMMLRLLVSSPEFDSYKQTAEQLGQIILSLQNADGSFNPWYLAPEVETVSLDRLLTFYSGEAILALLELYERTGEGKYIEAAQRSQNFYIGKYVTALEENYYPAYVPWHTLSLYTLFQMTHNQNYADAVFVLNDKLLELQDHSEHSGRFYNQDTPEYGAPHSASDAVYTEGLAYALLLAREVGDTERIEVYNRSLQLALQNLIRLQYQEKQFPSYIRVESYIGGIQTSAINPEIRVDNVQHAIDAFEIALQSLN